MKKKSKMEVEKEVNFYIEHIPYSTNKHLSECVDELSHLTDEILLKQRILTLTNLIRIKKLPSFFPIKKKELLSYISQKPRVSECITAQQMHFMSKFFEYLLQNPSKLVTVTAATYRDYSRSDFLYLVYSIIPSIFGYFSSNEHISFAYQFYSSLILNTSQSISQIVLPPFFLSSASFPFLQSLFEDISLYFCHDIRLISENITNEKNILEQHAKLLIKSIIEKMKLLPLYHLNLISLMQQNDWSQKDVFNFLIENIIQPQIRIMLKTSQYSLYAESFNHLCDITMKLFETTSNQFCLIQTKSIFEVPYCFTDFGKHFIKTVTTMQDAYSLFNFSKKAIKIPNLISKLVELDNNSNISFRPIFVKLYPTEFETEKLIDYSNGIVFKDSDEYSFENSTEEESKQDKSSEEESSSSVYERRWINLELKAKQENKYPIEVLQQYPTQNKEEEFVDYALERQYRNLIDKSHDFEIILKLKYGLESLRNWKNIVDQLYNIIIINFSQLFIQDYFDKKDPPHGGVIADFSSSNIFDNIAPILNTPYTHRLLLATRMEFLLNEWMSPDLIIMANKLKELWKEHMDTNFKSLELPSCFSNNSNSKTKRLLLNQYYLRISLSFESLFQVPFRKQFDYLINTVELVQQLAKIINAGNQLLIHSIKICSNSEIITLVLFISSTLTNSKEFWQTLTDKEKQNWKLLENVVLTMCDSNDELLLEYSNLKGELSKKASPSLIIPSS